MPRRRVSRSGAVLETRRPVNFKTLAEPFPRQTFASVELGHAALNLGVDGRFVFLQRGLTLALYLQSIEEYVFHALESAAMKPLLNESFNFGTVYFDGHKSSSS